MNIYLLHQKIHTELKRLKVTIKESNILISPTGKIESEIYTNCGHGKIDKNDAAQLIQAPQIRQILIDLKEVLKNLKNPLAQRFGPKMRDKLIAYIHDPEYPLSNRQKEVCVNYLISSNYEPPTAEALCNRWLGNLKPMFDTNKEQVLEELLNILKSI